DHPRRQRTQHQGRDGDPRSWRGATARRGGRHASPRPHRGNQRRCCVFRHAANRRGQNIPRGRTTGLMEGNTAMNMLTRRLLIAVTASLVFAGHAVAQDKSIVVASTTSTQDSGLFGHILPMFKARTGIDVKVVAQGTGQALDTARRGDADVVFVHAKSAEEKFLAEGFGVKRYPVMYNDFVLTGPASDPAGIKGSRDIVAALKAIKDKAAPFISVEGDRRLFNQYGVMLVNPAKHPSVKKELGQQFIDWLVSTDGQKAIAGYKIGGEQLFYPNASDPGA